MRVSRNIIYLLLAIVIVQTSCKSTISKEEFKSWVKSKENGFFKEKIVGDYKVSVQLMPKELLRNPGVEELVNFNVVIQSADKNRNLRKELNNQFGQKAKRYFAFEIEKDIYLEVKEEKKQASLCHFEQGTDLAKDYRLVLSFDAQTDQDFTLVMDPKHPSTGKVKFKFNKEDLLNKPSVTTDISFNEDKNDKKS